MMYKDYISAGGKGIINLLYQNQALKFLPADLITPLDNAYTRQNGLKVFADDVASSLDVSNDLTDIALELKSVYSELWDILYNAQPETMATSKTVVSGNDTTDTKNSVSAYDSDTMVDDNAINRTNNTSTTTTQTDYDKMVTVMEQLQQTDLWRKIKADLNVYLFISIYN